MAEAIADTGPILHLHEIGRLDALDVFERLHLPHGVAAELERLGLPQDSLLGGLAPDLAIASITETLPDLPSSGQPQDLQDADRQVLMLARRDGYRLPVLTDDLALRRRIEVEGGIAVGSVGVLVRSFQLGRSSASRIEESLDRLMTGSTLYMSRAFRDYVSRLLRDVTRT